MADTESFEVILTITGSKSLRLRAFRGSEGTGVPYQPENTHIVFPQATRYVQMSCRDD